MNNMDLCMLCGVFGGIITGVIFTIFNYIVYKNNTKRPKNNNTHHIQIIKDATKTTITRI